MSAILVTFPSAPEVSQEAIEKVCRSLCFIGYGSCDLFVIKFKCQCVCVAMF